MQRELLEGESLVMSSDNDQLVLTNKRVRFWGKINGAEAYRTMTLDSVGFASIGQADHKFLLLLALMSLGGVISLTQSIPGGVVSCIVFVLLYFVSRRTVMEIQSVTGQSIKVAMSGMKIEMCIQFLDQVEAEKIKYLSQ